MATSLTNPTGLTSSASTASDRLRVDELAAQSGVSVDTIRYYQKQGLLHHPAKEGRIGWYDHTHVARLDEIKRLADDGFTLAQIAELGNGSSEALLAELQRQRSNRRVTRDELLAETGLAAGPVDLAIAAGLLGPADATDFDASSIQMLTAAASLLDAGVPFTDLAKLAVRHAQHVESLVADAIELFIDNTDTDREGLAEEVSALVPTVAALVSQHFENTLVTSLIDTAKAHADGGVS